MVNYTSLCSSRLLPPSLPSAHLALNYAAALRLFGNVKKRGVCTALGLVASWCVCIHVPHVFVQVCCVCLYAAHMFGVCVSGLRSEGLQLWHTSLGALYSRGKHTHFSLGLPASRECQRKQRNTKCTHILSEHWRAAMTEDKGKNKIYGWKVSVRLAVLPFSLNLNPLAL